MKTTACIVLVFGLAAGFGAGYALAEDCEEAPRPGDPANIKKLKVDINVLNLMNGLHLSVDQVEAILAGAREVEKLRSELLPSRGRETSLPEAEARALCEILKEIKALYRRGEEPDPALLKRFREGWLKAHRSARKPRKKIDGAEYNRRLKAVENRVLSLLSDSQREVLADYKPCLIPPKNLRDPVRVGQVKSFQVQEKFLENIRRIPADRWKKLGRLIIDKALSRWEKRHGLLEPDERRKEIEKALSVVTEARALGDVDFQIRKSDLAKKITFVDKKEELQKELEGIIRKRHVPPGKLAHILLDARIIPVLEKRLALLRNLPRDEAVDLKDVKGADTCKDGKCGTKVKVGKK
jgi:hypothetical protein